MANSNYHKQKFDFLDELKPDDFRNASSFNDAEKIIDKLYTTALTKNDPKEFVQKAASNLFRENSLMVQKLIYLING